MRVYVNNLPLDLLPGMTVRHALVKADLLDRLTAGQLVYDEWGNEIGLDGAVHKNMKLFVRLPSASR
jgi:hypothetical protein